MITWDISNGSIEAHLVQLEAVFITKKYKEEGEKVACVLQSLTGRAKTVLEELTPTDKETYKALKDALIDRFGSTKSAQQYAVQLLAYKQEPDQTVASVHYEILRLISKAYPEIKDLETRKTLATSFFRKALRYDIRSKIDLTMDDSETLDNLLKRAKHFEQSCSLETSNANTVINAVSLTNPTENPGATTADEDKSDDRLSTLETQMEKLTVAVMKMSQGQSLPRRRSSAPPRCFNCHQIGHFARNCHRKNFDQTSGRGDAVNCFRCGKFGHRANACTTVLPPNQGN